MNDITLAWFLLTQQPFCQQPTAALDALRLKYAGIDDHTTIRLIASDQPFAQTVDALPQGLIDESVVFDYMSLADMPFRVAYSRRRNRVWLQYMDTAPESDTP